MAQPLKPSEIASLVASGIGESALVLEVFVARDVFAKMFADFGGELPALTQLMLGSLPYVLLALPSLLLMLAFAIDRRGPLLAAAAAVSLASAALFLVAMYLPIFELAGSIQA